MNRERHRYWSAYIAECQKRMLLADWNVVLARKPCAPGAAATVDARAPARHVLISLSENFDGFPRAGQRHAIVHELVHVHLAQLIGGAWRTLRRSYDGHQEDESVMRVFLHSLSAPEEYAVDDLARIIAPTMPLPPKVKP